MTCSTPTRVNVSSHALVFVVAGAEVLKDALAKLGLKCGGTMRQRAERLMLIKTTPLEKLDRKLFASMHEQGKGA